MTIKQVLDTFSLFHSYLFHHVSVSRIGITSAFFGFLQVQLGSWGLEAGS